MDDGDPLHLAEAFAREHAASPAQRDLLATAFRGLRDGLARRGGSPETLDCVRVPRLVYAAVRGTDTPVRPLTVALVLLFGGVRLLDDAMDGELPAVWQRHRPAEIALAAAALYSALAPLALCAVEAPPATILAMQRTLADGLLAMADGQQRDVALAGSAGATARDVVASVAGKSGAAVAMYAALAARLAGAPEEAVASYTAMGQALGTAWQLRSDIHDLFAASASSDLAAGARTLPIVLGLERADGAEREHLFALLERARTDAAAGEEVRARLRATGVLRDSALVVEVYCDRARRALTAAQPREPAGRVLRALIDGAALLDNEKTSGA